MRLGRSGNVSAIPGLSKKKLRREGSELVGRKVRLSHLVVQKPIGFIIETMGGGNLCLTPTFVDDTGRYTGWRAYDDSDGKHKLLRFQVRTKGRKKSSTQAK